VLFRSKYDWWILLIFAGFTLGNIWAIVSIFTGGGLGAWVVAIVFTPLTVFLFIPIWLRTYYQFDEDGLRIKCGLGKGIKIPYTAIISASKTRNPISSPAPSLDRIEIKFKKGSFSDTVIISPKDWQGFFEELKTKNENIEITADVKPMSKCVKLVIILLAGIPLLVIGIMIAYGEMEPAVNVSDDGIRIQAMYGLNIGFDSIDSIELIEQSMRDMRDGDSGHRANGYGGFGGTLKGHFQSSRYDSHVLFVRTNSSPTIRIERSRGGDIFISFRNGETTRAVFSEMIEAFSPK